MFRAMLLRVQEGEGEDVTKDEGNDEGEDGELGTARSISETSSTAPCPTFVNQLAYYTMFPIYSLELETNSVFLQLI
jgi:hypothetical protein